MDSKTGSRARGFALDEIDEVTYECSEELAGMYKLSPFVWRDRGGYELLLRVVNYSDDASTKIARIHSGFSSDGLHFVLEPNAVIAPGPDIPGSTDSGGCEDPTVAIVEARYYVYYSGWNEHIKRGELLLASGPTLQRLEKRGIALASSETLHNPKEATIVHVADGTWRLFFEFAEDDRSKIGLASSPNVDGPWTVLAPLFAARPGCWDDWHLSTGPIVGESDLPVMFYNGATRDAHWRIGWIVFDPLYTRVLARSEQPAIAPGQRRYAEDTDLAFAASAIEEDGMVRLYYSIADRHVMRVTLRRA